MPAAGVTCISPMAWALRDDLLVEVAFLARDRIGDRGLDRRRDRLVVGQADDRIGVIVERQPAPVGGLAEQQHGAADRRAWRRARPASPCRRRRCRFRRVRQRSMPACRARRAHREFARRARLRDCPRTFCSCGVKRRRAAQAEVGQAEPRARKLAVIGGGVLRRLFVERLGLGALAHGFGGAALPIAAARQRMRIDGAFA